MAVDESLLEAAVARDQCAVRLYRWSEATISLGYFQPADALVAFPEFARLPSVRRLSGGGAILHHHELTYSCALPASHELARRPEFLYVQIHQGLVDLLMQYGIASRLRGGAKKPADESFFCFGRSDSRDIVINNYKVLGSAQRRRRCAVLQHGSLLLKKSCHVPEFLGILDLADGNVVASRAESQITEQLASSILESIGCEGVPQQLTTAECSQVVQLETSRYRSFESIARRRLPTVP